MRTLLQALQKLKGERPIVMMTAYDASQAKLVDGIVDGVLVGDSLGMVVQGHATTIPVTLQQMVYHASLVVRGSEKACIVGDLPFMTYQESPAQALRSAGRLLQEAGVQAVKLEGGAAQAPAVEALVAAGIAVVGHLGVTPQAIGALGGYGKRGKSTLEAQRLHDDAHALEQAGLSMLVLENVPHDLAQALTAELDIPTIGIGAGPQCDGQIQVFHDLFGLDPNFRPRHAVRLAEAGQLIQDAARQYAEQVRSSRFISR